MINKKKKLKGISLLEVVISIAVVGIIALTMIQFVAFAYSQSTQLQKYSDMLLKNQGQMEETKESISQTLNDIVSLESKNDRTEDDDDELDDLNLSLASYTESKIKLFNEDVSLYYYDKELKNEQNESVYMINGVVKKELYVRPVPIIKSLEIKCNESNDSSEAFINYGQTTIKSYIDYEEKNKEYLYKTFFQWYITDHNFSASEYLSDDDSKPNGRNVIGDGLSIEKVIPYFPGSYTPLINEKSDTITLKPEYADKMLVCVAEPLSVTGVRGEAYVSNYIHVNSLPKLTVGNYDFVIDQSFQKIDKPSAELPIEWDKTTSVQNSAKKLSATYGNPKLFLSGEDCAFNKYGKVNARFIKFNSGDYANFYSESNSLIRWYNVQNKVVFAVARYINNENYVQGNFIDTMYCTPIAEYNNTGYLPEYNNGWKLDIMRVNTVDGMSEPADIVKIGGIGGASSYETDIAEIIILDDNASQSTESIDQVYKYLLDKYKFSDKPPVEE